MYNDKILERLKELGERFRTDLDEHDNYNLIVDTISEIEYVNDEIEKAENDFVHDMDMIEDDYKRDIDSLEDEIDNLKCEVNSLRKEIKKLERD